MATEAQIEAAAREMFNMSLGASMDLWHWPGNVPRRVPSRALGEIDQMTAPADDPGAPGGGKGPDNLREIARLVLEAAEAAR